MNKVLFIAYATKNTPYHDVFRQYLQPTLERFNLDWNLSLISNEGNWILNTAQKPKVLLDIMNQYQNAYDTFVYLDVDSKICQYPELFFSLDKKIDLCYHKLSWQEWYGYKNSNVKELLTGTLVLRYNDRVVNLLQEWYHESLRLKIWEQKCLEEILPKHKLNIYELPLSYCHINTLPGGKEPFIKCDDIVIEHYQLSRKLKKEINK